LQIAELVGGGWPVALALAAGAAGERVGSARRRAALNRALHELRRPLQVLALSGAAPAAASRPPGALHLAIAAVDDLDREINGSAPGLLRRPVACRALVCQAVERWRGPAAAAGRTLELRWSAGDALVLADPARIARALDNLIANSLEHGGLRVSVAATLGNGLFRVEVADRGRRRAAARTRPGRDPRRGHGLGLVARIAAEHSGRFRLERSVTGTIAVLELPLVT
jgi:signal transduction histidine kinase